MFKKIRIATSLMMVLMLVAVMRQTSAQESGPTKTTPENAEPGHTFRLDFTVSEIEDKKPINSRQYSMNLNAGDQNQIKIGSRVPFEQKQGEFTYIDVGTSIWCRMRDRHDLTWLGNDVLLNVHSEISNFAVPEQQGQNVRPLLRQLNIDASTITPVGKPLVVGSVDDPNSRRQFQLEVTVTKIR